MDKIRVGCVVCLLTLLALTVPGAKPQTQGQDRNQRTANRFIPNRLLIQFRPEVSSARAQSLIAGVGGRQSREIARVGIRVVDLLTDNDEDAVARALRSHPEVDFVEFDQILPVQQLSPNDPLYPYADSWHLRKINGPAAWSINTGVSNIVIAILDTGIDATHEDLATKLVDGWNVYNNNSDTSDVHGHGTAVAGVAAASGNNNLGVASVAWGCRIMPVRVSGADGYASYSDIADGLTWAADHGARVANISYDATDSSAVTSSARYFKRKGGVVTVAAGNSGYDSQSADNSYVLTVGATDQSDLLFSWSNRGKNLDMVAPGNVATTLRGGGYGVGGGTSVAAPIVAGAAALMFSVNPNLTPDEVQDKLKQSADDLGTAGWDTTFGHGRVNLERALNMALDSVGTVDMAPPTITITSPAEGATVSATVNVLVSASDDLGVEKVELYVDGALQDSSTSAPFTTRWNTRRAATGAHTLYTKAYDAAGNTSVSSSITVYK